MAVLELVEEMYADPVMRMFIDAWMRKHYPGAIERAAKRRKER